MKPTAKSKKGKNYENNIEVKFQPSKFPPRRIPKEVLKRTLEIANNTNDEFWLNKNISCTPPIHYKLNYHGGGSESREKLRLARKCMLTRDWKNLAKLLTSNFLGNSVLQKSSYPIFAEYATILLTFEDPELLQKLKQIMAPSAAAQTQSKSKKEDAEPKKTDNEEGNSGTK